MKVKIFTARQPIDLEEKVNKWLESHFIDADMSFQFQQSIIDDEAGYRMEYSLVLFYLPRADGKV